MTKCPVCSAPITVSLRKGKPAQESLPIDGKKYPRPEAFAAAQDMKETILSRFPDSPCGVNHKWKRMHWPWAMSFEVELANGGDANRLVKMAAWAMDNGFTITGPVDVKKKEAQIIQRRKQVDRDEPEEEEKLL